MSFAMDWCLVSKIPAHRGEDLQRQEGNGWRHGGHLVARAGGLQTRPCSNRRWSSLNSEPLAQALSRLSVDENPNRTRRKTEGCGSIESFKSRQMFRISRKVPREPYAGMASGTEIQEEIEPSKHPPQESYLTCVQSSLDSTVLDDVVPKKEPAIPQLPDFADAKPRVLFQSALQFGEGVSRPAHPPDQVPQPQSPSWQKDSDFDTQRRQLKATFDAELQHLQHLRSEIFGLRSQNHELRGLLREKQNAKSNLDDQLLQWARLKDLGVSPSGRLQNTQLNSFEGLHQLVEEYSKARDEFGPLEDDCNRLENQLYEKEFELHRLEDDFYTRWTVVPNTVFEFQKVPTFQPPPPPPQTEGFQETQEDLKYHPLVAKYLSKLGDIDILEERLDDVLDEKESLEDKRAARKRVNLILGPDEQTWLDGSKDLEHEILGQIKVLEAEAYDLKQECLARNLVDEQGEPTDLQMQEREIFREDVDSGSQISEYSKHPLLLPPPSAKQTEIEDSNPKPSEENSLFTVPGRINTWILQNLRISPLEVGLLARTYEGKGLETSHLWEKAVLDFWYKDGTITDASVGLRIYSSVSSALSSMVTQAPYRSKRPTRSADDASDSENGFHIFITSSLHFPSDRHDASEIEGALVSSPAYLRGKP